jgi:hypothetical protein
MKKKQINTGTNKMAKGIRFEAVQSSTLLEVQESYIIDDYYQSLMQGTKDLAKTLGVSEDCAAAVEYLRSRKRHTSQLESELIELYAKGNPPNNMSEFGVSCSTQLG